MKKLPFHSITANCSPFPLSATLFCSQLLIHPDESPHMYSDNKNKHKVKKRVWNESKRIAGIKNLDLIRLTFHHNQGVGLIGNIIVIGKNNKDIYNWII